MTDFVDSLKDIKKELLKEQGANLSKNDTQSVNLGENSSKNSAQKAEFESPQAKERRLQAEIAEFIKGEN